MTQPLSNDLRERVVAAVLGGANSREAAARFDVAVSSVVKLMQRYRTTGSVAPGKIGGHRKRILVPHRDFIQERLKQTPLLSLYALKAELAARGVSVSHNAVWEFLRCEGLRFKKKLLALEQARPDVARRRQRWKTRRQSFDPAKLVFIDETWIKTNMAPCAAGGQRASACALMLRMAIGER